MLRLVERDLVIAAVTELTSGPWRAVLFGQVDTTVIPRIAISIETSSRLDGYQGRLGNIA